MTVHDATGYRWGPGHAGGGAVLAQLVRFGVVGCCNTALSWCVYALLVACGVEVLLASAIAWTVGAVNSYLLNRRWTFRSRGRWAPEILRFGAVQCAGLALDVVLLDALTRDAGVHELVAQALVYPATTVATFALSRQWAFSTLGSDGQMAGLTRVAPATTGVVRRRLGSAQLAGGAGLVGACALGVALRVANFAAVPTTPFYDAAVRSMGLSLHNFVYGTLDPGGQLAVDKPPLDMWLQVASTKLLGFSSVALRLPPAVAGMLAIPLLYALVRRGAGRAAGVATAIAFAVLPATVLTSRSDTMDTVMATLLVLAAWLIVRAAPDRRARHVVAAGAVAGLAFEVKLTEATVALPALALMAFTALDAHKTRTLALAAGAFLVAAAWWAVIASLLPGRHPFAYGSSDGSIWKDIIIYNGVSRLGNPPTSSTTPGLLRLFDASAPRYFGELIGAELLCALAAAALAGAYTWRRRRQAPPIDDSERLRRAVRRGIGTWLILGFLVASFMGRQWPRYLEAFTPAVAAALGIGIVTLAETGARRPGALAGLGAVALVAAIAGRLTDGNPIATAAAGALAVAAALAIAAAAALPARRRTLAAVGAALVLAASLAVPLATSARLVRDGAGDGEPTGALPAAELDRLSTYLRAHQGHARYEVAGAVIFDTVALIANDALPVQTLASVGDRPLLTPAQLERESRSGAVRYALIGRPKCLRDGGIGNCPPVIRWAREHGTDVSLAAGLPRRGTLYRLTP